jgi:phage baseplate assembly protein gpV
VQESRHLTRAYAEGAIVEYIYAAHSLMANLPASATTLIVALGSVTVQTRQATVKTEDVMLDTR